MTARCSHVWHVRTTEPEPHSHCRACRQWLQPYDDVRRGKPVALPGCPYKGCPHYTPDRPR